MYNEINNYAKCFFFIIYVLNNVICVTENQNVQLNQYSKLACAPVSISL